MYTAAVEDALVDGLDELKLKLTSYQDRSQVAQYFASAVHIVYVYTCVAVADLFRERN